MNMKRFFRLFLVVSVAFVASSCLTPKKVRFLQDMEQKRVVELPQRFEAVISRGDQLTIRVLSDHFENELANPFNTGSNYLVDVNGDIVMPVIGKMHVAGLTRLQMIDTVTLRLQQESFMGDPRVDVRISNFRIFILSSHGGGSITIPNERCTLLEALALSGVSDIKNRRDKIGVLREVDGKMVLRYLDPRTTDVFADPFFNLCQNDIIITDVYGTTYFKEWLSGWTVVTSTLAVVSSVVSVYALIRSLTTSNNSGR